MLIRIDIDKENLVERGDDYFVIRTRQLPWNREEHVAKIRTAQSEDPAVFVNGDPKGLIKKARSIYVGVVGGIKCINPFA